jgi:hypothetical protein
MHLVGLKVNEDLRDPATNAREFLNVVETRPSRVDTNSPEARGDLVVSSEWTMSLAGIVRRLFQSSLQEALSPTLLILGSHGNTLDSDTLFPDDGASAPRTFPTDSLSARQTPRKDLPCSR